MLRNKDKPNQLVNHHQVNQQLKIYLNQLNLKSIEEEKINRLSQFIFILQQYNQKVNLIGSQDLDTIITKHVIDSLLPWSFFPTKDEVAHLADLGSGGGLPVIPLAIFLPHLHFSLIEAKKKKTTFLKNIQQQLKLNNIEIITANIMEVKKKFNFFIARGFGSLKKIISITKKITARPCTFLLYKGKKEVIQKELQAIKNIKKRQTIFLLEHSFFAGERNLVKITLK